MKDIQEHNEKQKLHRDLMIKGFTFEESLNIIEKSWSNDLNKKFPKGEWKTINGAKVFINDGKVVAGLDGFNGEIDNFFDKEKEDNKPMTVDRYRKLSKE